MTSIILRKIAWYVHKKPADYLLAFLIKHAEPAGNVLSVCRTVCLVK